MRLRTSFWALLGRDTEEAPEVVLGKIRHAMVAALDHTCAEEHFPLNLKIKLARDIHVLWYLRTDLMAALSSCGGEMEARKVLATITPLFKGHHPSATPSKFGSL